MYQHFKYEIPMTGKAALKKKPALPGWSAINLDVSEASATIKAMENDPIRHGYYTNIFGMVKLIDDQVGKLFEFLESNGVSDNTIVVFTSGMCLAKTLRFFCIHDLN
jgi:arylsulfatase A-like enzyme